MADEEILRDPDSAKIGIEEIPMKVIESEDAKSIYHEILQSKRFLLNITLVKKFHSDFLSKSSKKFQLLAADLEEELREIFPLVTFSLQRVMKVGAFGRKIFATFACEMPAGEMEVEKFERRLRNFVMMSERLTATKARFWELKCKEVSDEEFEHFKKFGFDCCDNCAKFAEFYPSSTLLSMRIIQISFTIFSVLFLVFLLMKLLKQF